jgi:4-hydroxy-tetrahydrodipicolinate synthase
MAQMVGSAIAGDWATARAINRQYYRLMQAHFWEASPGPVKAVLALMGRGEDRLRLPMTPVSAPTRRKLEVLLGELGLLAGAEAVGEKVRMF